MENERQTTVLFADISGSTKLYEDEGDKAAMEAIARCLEELQKAVTSSNGRVVKTIGDEVMAVFRHPDGAAMTAGKMQNAIDALPFVGDTKLAVRVGFHTGPVIQSENDLFGDTVNIASRLTEQAGRGQIITSQETANQLGPTYRDSTRPLYAIHMKGKAEEVALCELIWRRVGDMTVSFATRTITRPVTIKMRLVYQGREIVRRRDRDSIVLGRDQQCGLVVTGTMASRQHCVIERRGDKFILADQSTNGTYVTPEGGAEILLQREEFTLNRHGWISFGQPRAHTDDIVEYFTELS